MQHERAIAMSSNLPFCCCLVLLTAAVSGCSRQASEPNQSALVDHTADILCDLADGDAAVTLIPSQSNDALEHLQLVGAARTGKAIGDDIVRLPSVGDGTAAIWPIRIAAANPCSEAEIARLPPLPASTQCWSWQR